MTTVAKARVSQRIRRVVFFLAFTFLLLMIDYLFGPKFGAILEGLTPPELRSVAYDRVPQRLSQNWSLDVSRKFHSIGQGTSTLPIPFSWLLALEQPHGNLFAIPFFANGQFMDDSYVLRFGFVKGEVSSENPYGLPVGITTTPNQNLDGASGMQEAVGFTCAACHTAQISYGEYLYLVDGGPSSADLGLLTSALGAALAQTAISAKLPFFNKRFRRFAKLVLGDAHSAQREAALEEELTSVLGALVKKPQPVNVVEGFTRLDALNRIGNQTFSLSQNRPENYVSINAPVNYPHIWTSSWFDWVQYDGSIMSPLVRNVGESLGVAAYFNTTAPREEHRFSSSVNFENLLWIEEALSGPPPFADRKFQGLSGPAWPDTFPPINEELARVGRGLYLAHCQGCHLPPVDSPEFWENFYEVEYSVGEKTELKTTTNKLLKVNVVPLEQIGTDPAQSRVLTERTVNTAGLSSDDYGEGSSGMGLSTTVCVVLHEPANSPVLGGSAEQPGWYPPGAEKLVTIRIGDSSTNRFSLALGALVQEVIDVWFTEANIPPEQQAKYLKGIPNCLRAGAGYKARPLNGVWATAPFLHNGAIPTVYDMIVPAEERPKLVQLGGTEYDLEQLGLDQDDHIITQAARHPDKRYLDGYFILDTSLPGNLNSGHEFTSRWLSDKHWSEQPEGVIGPLLEHEERMAIIEFLKTQ